VTQTMSVAMDHERGPFAGLLVAQLFFIGVTPFVNDTGTGNVFLHVAVFAILAASAYVSWSSRNLLIISIVFFVGAAVSWLGPDFLPGVIDELLRFLIVGVGFAFTAAIILVTVARHERVTTDTILGGINAYLLIACAFTMFHAVVLVVDPGAYQLDGSPLQEVFDRSRDSRGFSTLLYFSFSTLTTVGFGDITPVHPVARMLTSFEAVMGQLYVAIFIARLVSLEVSQKFGPH
jgi:hypothetical protein